MFYWVAFSEISAHNYRFCAFAWVCRAFLAVERHLLVDVCREAVVFLQEGHEKPYEVPIWHMNYVIPHISNDVPFDIILEPIKSCIKHHYVMIQFYTAFLTVVVSHMAFFKNSIWLVGCLHKYKLKRTINES